ncbi:cell division protein DivIVA, partial [Spirillospora sp. NPDC049652]
AVRPRPASGRGRPAVPAQTGPQPIAAPSADQRNGASSQPGNSPFGSPEASQPHQQVQHSATGAFHTGDNPPHERR